MVVGGQKTKTIHSVLLAFKNAVVQKYDDKILNILKLYGHSRINLFFQLKMFDREDNKTFILNHDPLENVWKNEENQNTNKSDPDTGKRYIYRSDTGQGLWIYDWDTDAKAVLELSCECY